MEELAFVSIPQESMPNDLAALQTKLEENRLLGSYTIDDDTLMLENEDGIYEFRLATEDDFEGSGYGVEVAGEWEDAAAVLIDLQEIFEDAFPDSEFSSAFDF